MPIAKLMPHLGGDGKQARAADDTYASSCSSNSAGDANGVSTASAS